MQMRQVFSVLVVACAAASCLDVDDSHYRFVCEGACNDGGGGGTGTIDAGRKDGGSESSCASNCAVPSPTCSDSKTLVVPRLRACSGTTCQFESTTITCSQSCAAGACLNEPCAGVVCNAAPASTCLDQTALKVFVTPGSCQDGLCGYSSGSVTCAGGCSNGACLGNPCTGKTCTLPPATTCVGNVLRTYASLGVCDGANGSCTYERIDTVCAAGCANAMCTADPCRGVTCNTPPAPSCTATNSRQYFATSGVCNGGSCSYVAMNETCTAGKTCQAGQCVTPPPTCTSANCAGGCCAGTTCVPYASQSATSCGTAANTCLACSAGYSCTTGACTDVNECNVNNGGCDAHADCTNTPGSRTCGCKAGYFGDGLTCLPVADGGTPAWVKVRDAGISTEPEARRGAGMAFDSAAGPDGSTVMFGGYDGVNHFNATWLWSGRKWTKASEAGPTARRLPSMVFDSARLMTVLFGGYDGTKTFSDTWEWNGTWWTLKSPLTAPSQRYGASVAYDSSREVTVLFGGQSSNMPAELNDTWEYDGSNWSKRLPATSPTIRFGAAMAFDSVRNRIVLFGGSAMGVPSAETWEWDGSDWALRPTGPGPGSRFGAAAAFIGGRVVLYGGTNGVGAFSDTWEWNGVSWSLRSTVSPGSRVYAASTADTVRGRIVLFGGETSLSGGYLGDTWEYGP